MQVNNAPTLTIKRQSPWKLALNIALPVVLIAIFAWQIHTNWTAIAKEPWSISWGLAALAVTVLLVNSCLEVLIWNRTLGWFTKQLPFRQVVPIYIWSSLARYVPGKVFSLVLRVALTTEVKRDIVPVLASSTVELALRTASGLLLLIIALLGWGIHAKWFMLLLPLIIIPLVLVCVHPRIMLPVMNWALRKIKQQPITQTLSYGEILGIFVATILRWMVYGLAYAILACALCPPARHHFPVLIGTAAGSWAAGFVSLLPGGLGSAEIVQKTILTSVLPLYVGLAFILPIIFRFATLAAEGLWALAAMFMWRRRHLEN